MVYDRMFRTVISQGVAISSTPFHLRNTALNRGPYTAMAVFITFFEGPKREATTCERYVQSL